MSIKANRARCRSCGDVIESKYRHDFVQCSCGESFVDGGLDYLRRGGELDDMSEWDPDPIEDEEQVPLPFNASNVPDRLARLVIDFDNPFARAQFLSWMCESGEQEYWDYMQYREAEHDDGDITVVNFDYPEDFESDDPSDAELHVHAMCGRLDKD